MSILRKEKCYKDPILVTVDDGIVRNRTLILAAKKSTIVTMNTSYMFKAFFELPGIFDALMENTKRLESESDSEISNIIQGSVWKNRKQIFG